MFVLGGVSLKVRRDSYQGLGYDDQASVIKLIGDGTSADKNEVVQASAKGARSATLSCFADSAAARDQLVNMLFTEQSFTDQDGTRTVVVTSARAEVWHWEAGSNAKWLVHLTLRER